MLSEVAGKLGVSFVWPQGWGCKNWPHPCSISRRVHRFTTSSPERTCRMCYFLLSLSCECQSGGGGQCRGTGTASRSGGPELDHGGELIGLNLNKPHPSFKFNEAIQRCLWASMSELLRKWVLCVFGLMSPDTTNWKRLEVSRVNKL